MSRSGLWLLGLLALAMLALWRHAGDGAPGLQERQFAHAPCAIPVHYRLGETDPRFGFDRLAITAALVEALNLWQVLSDTVLFIESDQPGAMIISMPFDQRQALANTRSALRGDMERDRAQLEGDEAMLRQWGERIEARRQALEKEAPQMTVDNVRRTVDDLQREIEAYNRRAADMQQRVADFRSRVARYNEASSGGPVESGLYRYERTLGRRIEVFRAESYEELVRVLAHELGHALGIGHVDDAGAVMNPLLHHAGEVQPGRMQPVALAEADRRALLEVCGERLGASAPPELR